MKYKTAEERLDNGLCPLCETDLVKHCHLPNHEESDDKTSECPKCGWRDE
jgi:predicted RNA-binding Zn-ribbon protein involved in translation (DUF1610 family)